MCLFCKARGSILSSLRNRASDSLDWHVLYCHHSSTTRYSHRFCGNKGCGINGALLYMACAFQCAFLAAKCRARFS